MSNTSSIANFTQFCLAAINSNDSIEHIQRMTRLYLSTVGITYREFCHVNDSTDISYSTLSQFLTAELECLAIVELSNL